VNGILRRNNHVHDTEASLACVRIPKFLLKKTFKSLVNCRPIGLLKQTFENVETTDIQLDSSKKQNAPDKTLIQKRSARNIIQSKR